MESRNYGPFVVAIIAALCIIFGAKALFFKSKPVMQLPEGEQQVVGVLKSVSLSATRRGTHVLEVDGKALTFVEAAKSLKAYENLRVTVTGLFEENIDPDLLPVLIATDVRTKALALKEWKFDELGLTLSVPETWTRNSSDTSSFFDSEHASTAPWTLMVVAADMDELPSGESLTVGGAKAVRLKDGSGESIFLKGANNQVVAISFQETADDDEGTAEQRYAFGQVILRSVKLAGMSASSSVSVAATGTGTSTLGMPCGGDAGILCPAGQFCEVVDAVTNIGRCKAF